VEQVEARLLDGDDIGSSQQVGKRVNAARAVSGAVPGPTVTPAPTSRIPTATPVPDKDTATADAINAQRKSRGLPPLVIDSALVAIAHDHNAYEDETNCFDHNCPGEETVWQRLARAGYPNYAGSEIILKGCDTVACAIDGWMNSSPHRAIVLGSYTHIGCGFDDFSAGYHLGLLWTCDFGRRSGGAPTPTPPPSRGLLPGYRMLVYLPRMTTPAVYDYDDPTITKTLTDALYQNVCVDLKAFGARCEWPHKTNSLGEPDLPPGIEFDPATGGYK
jgi:uncharacterized protein YkwD